MPTNVISKDGPGLETFRRDLTPRVGNAVNPEFHESIAGLLLEKLDFDPAPTRFRLIDCPDQTVLLIICDYVLTDQWSNMLLTRDFMSLFDSASGLGSDDEPPLPVDYSQFAIEETQPEEQRRFSDNLNWWRDHLAGAGHAVLWYEQALPTANSSERMIAPLPALRLDELRSCAWRLRTTMSLLLVAAVAYARLIADRVACLNLMLPSRHRARFSRVMGNFSNPVPVCFRARNGQSIAEFATYVRDVILEAHGHEVPSRLLYEDAGRLPMGDMWLNFAPQEGPPQTRQSAVWSPLFVPLPPRPLFSGVKCYLWLQLEVGQTATAFADRAREVSSTQIEQWLTAMSTFVRRAIENPLQSAF